MAGWPLLAPGKPADWVQSVRGHATGCIEVLRSVTAACSACVGDAGSKGKKRGAKGKAAGAGAGDLVLGELAVGAVTAPAALLAACRQAAAGITGAPVSGLRLQCRVGGGGGAGEGEGEGSSAPASMVVPVLVAEGCAWENGSLRPSASLRNAVRGVCLWWEEAEAEEEGGGKGGT